MGVLGAISANAAKADLLFFVLFGVLGYFYAQSMRRRLGTTPWRLPAALWALICAMVPLGLGFLIEVVAGVTTRSRKSPFGPPPGDYMARANSAAPGPSAMTFPAAPPANPAGGAEAWPSDHSLRTGPNGWRSTPGGEPPPLFGWYADPDGDHEERYWDGRMWTDSVRDGGVTSISPLRTLTSFWAPAAGRPMEEGQPSA